MTMFCQKSCVNSQKMFCYVSVNPKILRLMTVLDTGYWWQSQIARLRPAIFKLKRGTISHDPKQSFRTEILRGKERRKQETKDDLMSYTKAMKSTHQ